MSRRERKRQLHAVGRSGRLVRRQSLLASQEAPLASLPPPLGVHAGERHSQETTVLGQHMALKQEGLQIWWFPKIRGTCLGVPIIRTIVYWGLYWGTRILGNYHTKNNH